MLEVRDVVRYLRLAVLACHPRRADARLDLRSTLGDRIEIEPRECLRRDDQARAVVERREPLHEPARELRVAMRDDPQLARKAVGRADRVIAGRSPYVE